MPFVLLTLVLVHARAPWIDEAWEAGPAITLLRKGQILDFGACRWSADLPHATKHEAHALLQATWYGLGGVDLSWGRLLDVLCGAVFLVAIVLCLGLVGASSGARRVVLALIGTNYYLLVASSQIRPEAPALCASAIGLFAFLRWQGRTSGFAWLFGSHAAMLAASTLHLQAAFLVAGLWAAMLAIRVKALPLRQWLSLGVLYLAVVGGYLIYVRQFWGEWAAQLNHLFGGDMLGHRGGMIMAVARYVSNGELEKAAVAAGIIACVGAGLVLWWEPSGQRRAMVIIAAAGYASWLLTTTHIDDYHTAWLMPAMALIAASVGEEPRGRASGVARALRVSTAFPIVLLSLYGCVWALRTGLENPRKSLFERDLRAFDERFELRAGGVLGPREIAWYFDYDTSVLCWREGEPLQFYVDDHKRSAESTRVAGYTYNVAAEGRHFTLYELAP